MDRLRSLTRAVARELGEGPGPERRARQRLAVARLGRRAAADPAPGRWRWAIPALAIALLLLTWIAVPPRAPEVATRIDTQRSMAGAWWVASSEPLAVVFPDRSRVTLAPGARIRLAQVEATRVQVELGGGRVTLAPGATRAWQVLAGPYTIEAGAGVQVEWAAEASTLVVEAGEGGALVRGGALASEGTRLGAGQRIELDGREVVTHAARVPGAAVVRPEVPRPASRAAQAGAGEHAAALAEVEGVGFAGQLERLDAAGLDRLAHSARLAGAGGRAREALLALRRRFPRDSRAGTAAFVLARIALDLDRDPAAAVVWLDRHLAEQPRGPLAEQARARRLRTLHELGDPRARGAAGDYLQHHPHGDHASLARTIVDG